MHVDGVLAGNDILESAATLLGLAGGGLVGLAGLRHGDGVRGCIGCRLSMVAGDLFKPSLRKFVSLLAKLGSVCASVAAGCPDAK